MMRSRQMLLPTIFISWLLVCGHSLPSARAQTTCAPSSDIVNAVNNIRSAAGLNCVVENTTESPTTPISTDAVQAGVYVLLNNPANGHIQTQGNNNGWSVGGSTAAAQGDIAFGSGEPPSAASAAQGFMVGGYHWERVLDPNLQSIAYGVATAQSLATAQNVAARAVIPASTPWTWVSVLVFNDSPIRATLAKPILWPPDGGQMSFLNRTPGESPDPMANCTGFSGYSMATGTTLLNPTGPSLSLQSPMALPATGLNVSLTQNGTPVTPLCWFTAGNVQFTAPDQTAGWSAVGENILTNSNALDIFPQNPLSNGVYTVTITSNNQPFCSWSFGVGGAAATAVNQCTLGQSACAIGNWSGTWTDSTFFGPLTLTQVNGQVMGSFSFDFTGFGQVAATTSGSAANPITLVSQSQTPAPPVNVPITFKLTMSADGTSYTGTSTWGTGQPRAMSGSRPCLPATTTMPNPNQPANTNLPATTTAPTDTNTPTTPANATTNPTTGPNAPAQPPATTGWAGTWNTDFGLLTLTQNSNQVTGTFQDQTGNPGTITGTANGNVLTATWDLAPSTPGMSTITLVLTESADGSSFTGTFDRGGGITGPWNGTRAGP